MTLLNNIKNKEFTAPYFFDVPVYRLSQDSYYKKMDEYIEKQINDSKSESIVNIYYQKCPQAEEQMRNHLRNKYGGAWDYNEIIGYIRLNFVGTQIRGECWQTKGKRIVKTKRKTFEWVHWKLADEINIPYKSDNQKIFSIICRYLDDCAKELKNRYIDISHFKHIGRYVDWKSLMAEKG